VVLFCLRAVDLYFALFKACFLAFEENLWLLTCRLNAVKIKSRGQETRLLGKNEIRRQE